MDQPTTPAEQAPSSGRRRRRRSSPRPRRAPARHSGGLHLARHRRRPRQAVAHVQPHRERRRARRDPGRLDALPRGRRPLAVCTRCSRPGARSRPPAARSTSSPTASSRGRACSAPASRYLTEDTSLRRRIAFWRFMWRFIALLPGALRRHPVLHGHPARRPGELRRQHRLGDRPRRRRSRASGTAWTPPSRAQLLFILLINLFIGAIFIVPMVLMAVRQMKSYEPGDASWGVEIDHVRGQADVKEEVRKIIELWQAGDQFKLSGGKPRARAALHRAAGHRQDDARQGDRHGLQRALHGRARLGLRADVHRHGRRRRAVDGPQGQEARAQVGRPLHRLHRRDRRGRHAPRRARRRRAPSRVPCRAADVRPARRAHRLGRRHHRDARVARATCGAQMAEAERAPVRARAVQLDRARRDARDVRRPGQRRAQPAAGRDGRRRQPAVPEAHVARASSTRCSTPRTSSRSASGRCPCACRGPSRATTRCSSSARRTCRSSVLDPALTRAGRMGRQVQFRIPNKVDRIDVLDFYLAKVAHTPDLDSEQAPRRARAHDRRLLAGA